VNRQADPGLQPQRTSLAWSRTALAMVVNAVLVLRAGMVESDAGLLLLGGLLVVVSGGFVAAGRWRRRELARPDAGGPPDWLLAWTATGTVLACLAGGWTALR